MKAYTSQETRNMLINLFKQEIFCDIPATFFDKTTSQFID